MNRNILVIAGLDPSGCAGLIADLRTMMAWRTYGMGVITAVASQNTQRIESVYPVPPEVIGAQIEAIVGDIEVHAVKIGLLPNTMTLELVAELCRSFQFSSIVVDPVLRSSTGYQFADEKLVQAYKQKLFPIAEVVTPNLDEAAVFAQMEVKDVGGMKSAAEKIHAMGCKNVIVTGGHLEGRAMDVLYDGLKHTVFDAPKLSSTNTRGLGCTFASIMALHLAKKIKVASAIDPAKKYIARAMAHPFKIGHGPGPLNHNVAI